MFNSTSSQNTRQTHSIFVATQNAHGTLGNCDFELVKLLQIKRIFLLRRAPTGPPWSWDLDQLLLADVSLRGSLSNSCWSFPAESATGWSPAKIHRLWLDEDGSGNQLDGASSLLRQRANAANVRISTDSLRRRETSSLLGIVVRLSDADKPSDSAVIPTRGGMRGPGERSRLGGDKRRAVHHAQHVPAVLDPHQVRSATKTNPSSGLGC